MIQHNDNATTLIPAPSTRRNSAQGRKAATRPSSISPAERRRIQAQARACNCAFFRDHPNGALIRAYRLGEEPEGVRVRVREVVVLSLDDQQGAYWPHTRRVVAGSVEWEERDANPHLCDGAGVTYIVPRRRIGGR